MELPFIEAETGVRRETVSGYDPAAPVKCGQNVPRLRASYPTGISRSFAQSATQ